MINVNDIASERYKIINVVGHGGMSDVFEARDIIFKRPVALKVLRQEYMNNIENLIRFQNEARISSALNHPNIVKIYDYGEIDNLPFIAYEFIKDQTLRDVLDFKRYLSVPEACSVMLEILEGVNYIHSRNVIHRDLKPLNIFYGADGSVKISDFGISVIVGSKMNVNENAKIMGTAQYLAPELIRGGKPSFQSDIYSLGITFYEIITGKVPFDSSDPKEVVAMQVKKVMPSPILLMPNTPKEIERIIFKATAKDPIKRYKTCQEMKEDIAMVYRNKKMMNKGHSRLARIFGLSND
jgi:serine/threonine-protein kinase